MSPRLWEHRVADILDAIRKIQAYVEGMSFRQFQSDPKTVDALIRNFIVIGEAARSVPGEITDKHPNIPWRLMGDMRNFAIHEYWGGGVTDDMGDYQKGSSPFDPTVGHCSEGRRWGLI
jgi:uncharacterized protein with HEPN domain